MKYRVKGFDGRFYPQYRLLFSWFYYYSCSDNVISFSSLEGAKNYITKKETQPNYYEVEL